MRPRTFFFRLERIAVPTALLAAVLQRAPAVRIAVAAVDYVLESSGALVLKASAASIAALGLAVFYSVDRAGDR